MTSEGAAVPTPDYEHILRFPWLNSGTGDAFVVQVLILRYLTNQVSILPSSTVS